MCGLRINYGSEIKFKPYRKGVKKGLKYSWVASVNKDHPNTTFIHANSKWDALGLNKRMIRKLTKTISHETIHNIVWYYAGVHDMPSHDLVFQPFKRLVKKEDPEHYKELGL